MSDLTRFQNAFCAALTGDGSALQAWGIADAPGLSVYRNTVTKGVVDALVETYPTVKLMVGEAWLRAAASAYGQEHPPQAPSLQAYGAGFADWLDAFPPAEDTRYLPAMARLDQMWWSSYFAADASPLQAETFTGLTPDALAEFCARLHPSVRLGAFKRNLASLWLAHQPPHKPPTEFEITAAPEWIIISRPALEVRSQTLDLATYAFLSACAAGESLLVAAERALAADPSADFSSTITTGLDLGAFVRLDAKSQGRSPS